MILLQRGGENGLENGAVKRDHPLPLGQKWVENVTQNRYLDLFCSCNDPKMDGTYYHFIYTFSSSVSSLLPNLSISQCRYQFSHIQFRNLAFLKFDLSSICISLDTILGYRMLIVCLQWYKDRRKWSLAWVSPEYV